MERGGEDGWMDNRDRKRRVLIVDRYSSVINYMIDR